MLYEKWQKSQQCNRLRKGTITISIQLYMAGVKTTECKRDFFQAFFNCKESDRSSMLGRNFIEKLGGFRPQFFPVLIFDCGFWMRRNCIQFLGGTWKIYEFLEKDWKFFFKQQQWMQFCVSISSNPSSQFGKMSLLLKCSNYWLKYRYK